MPCLSYIVKKYLTPDEFKNYQDARKSAGIVTKRPKDFKDPEVLKYELMAYNRQIEAKLESLRKRRKRQFPNEEIL